MISVEAEQMTGNNELSLCMLIDGVVKRFPTAIVTRSPAIAEGPRDAGVPVEIW